MAFNPDIFLNGEDVSDMSNEEIRAAIKPINGLRVNRVFEDDHVTCFDVSYLLDEEWHQIVHYWVGDKYRMFYHAEIDENVRKGELLDFIVAEICDYY